LLLYLVAFLAFAVSTVVPVPRVNLIALGLACLALAALFASWPAHVVT
jgi:hypothetical protein